MNMESGPQIDTTLEPERKASAGTVMVTTLAGIAILTMVLYGINRPQSPNESSSAVASNAPADSTAVASTGDPAAASQNLKTQNATDQSKPAQGQQQKANDQAQQKNAAPSQADAKPNVTNAKPEPANNGQAPANQAASNPPGSNSSGNSKQNNAESTPQDNAQPAVKPNG